jgi:H+-transporting ATPase
MTQSQKPEPRVQSQSSGKIDYEHLGISEALKQLGVDPKSGLSDAEAKTRLEKYGPNALAEKKVSAFEMFGKFFWGPMPWMIEAAAIMSILVKDLIDFIIIMVMLLFNAVLGFWHERQARLCPRCSQ